MDIEKYLRRIGLDASRVPVTPEGLKLLQKRHLLSVPFENLDIHWKRPIRLDTESFYRKIVEEKRGGFCYELNGLFGELLNALGFSSFIVSARVASGAGDFGAEYDHLAILTEVGGERFLVDVGFGDFAAEPLNFSLDVEQRDANGTFSIRRFDDEYFEVVKITGEGLKSEYIFKDTPRELAEFAAMCEFHQTSKESHFTRGKLCSLMLENGRKTLTDKRFIETAGGAKRELEIASEDQFNAILSREFRIEKSF